MQSKPTKETLVCQLTDQERREYGIQLATTLGDMENVEAEKIQRHHLHVIRVTGIPKGQPRPRAFVRGKRAAVYDPGTAENWKGDVARACSTLEGARLHTPLSVTMTFFLPRPKSHFGAGGDLKPSAPRYMHDGKPDADNLAKAVLDALTNIGVWIDDDQVCELTVRKYWEQPRENPPGCVIRMAELREVEM